VLERPAWILKIPVTGGSVASRRENTVDGLIESPAINPDQLARDAWSAMAQRDWDAALASWALMRECFPERNDGHVRPVQTLWLAGRLDEAEAMAAATLTRLPQDADALVLHAWLAVRREEWDEAARRWERARLVAPDRPEIDVGLMRSLRLTGCLDEAEAIAADALVRFSDHPELLIENVWLAISRRQWSEAAARARVARNRLAALGQDSIPLGAAEYRIAMRTKRGAGPEIAAVSPQAEPGADNVPETARLMLAFESLGELCDLGLAQRHYGVEPFGLLRFASTPYSGLIAALETRFEGVGEADTEFKHRNGELIADVNRYGLSFHTFTYENELTKSGKHERFYRRWLAHLRNKLVADLEAGEKIFAYGSAAGLLDGEIDKLFALLREYGPSSLLCVRQADATHCDGTVEVRRAGLYVGYLGRFAAFEAGEQPSFESWRTICENTYRMSRQLQKRLAIGDAFSAHTRPHAGQSAQA
jgi:hypothetical protein